MSAANMQDQLMNVWNDAENWISKAAGEKTALGEPKHVDMPAFLASRFPTANAMGLHSLGLQALEARALLIVKMREPAKSEAYLRTVPAGDPAVQPSDGTEAAVVKHRTRLWQYGMEEQFSLKGASPLHAVLKCMKNNLMGKHGNNTEKHPIEALYNLVFPLQQGDPIPDFSTGVANGNAVVISCHALCLVAMELRWLEADSELSSHPAIQLEVAKRLIKCLRLTCTHSPNQDLEGLIQETLSSKIQASSRTRPTTLQMLYSFLRLVRTRVTPRLSANDVLKAILADYNTAEAMQTFRLNHDETHAIKFLHSRSEVFRARIKVIWGQERPASTAWPMNFFAEPWLQEDAKLPVSEP